MSPRPAYFDKIQQHATDLWQTLESNREIAAAWWLLFKQVQSPRHIISELLQNADDAGSNEATVRIEDGFFVFKHKGKDFNEGDFASLCGFGCSNKTWLHTIGFYGIGFKSTFSLGNRVELFTPTLSVAFDKDQFTLPKWVSGSDVSDDTTTVRIAIESYHKQAEVEENLQEWLKSPISLLFFKNIRRVEIGEDVLRWDDYGSGPVKGTHWLTLHDNPEKKFLKARSAPEPFPEDSLAEIKKENMGSDEHADLPQCSVEVVLGAAGNLYVVLPTSVRTELPFACNAPFIQDPARNNIKPPGTSPTNKWLLARAGKLAADVMLQWLKQSTLDPTERAKAYGLLPDVDHQDTSLGGTCGRIAEEAFAEVIQDKEFLLTDVGQLVEQKGSIIIPSPIFNVWPSEQVTKLFDYDERPAFSRHVLDQDRKKLLHWEIIERVDANEILSVLRNNQLPKPKNWQRLLSLWDYIAPMVTEYNFRNRIHELSIIPVQGKDVLYSANEVVRLGMKKFLPTSDDWRFLGDGLSVLDQRWLRYLTKQLRVAKQTGNEELARQVESANSVLKTISLNEPSNTGKIMDQAAKYFFTSENRSLTDAIRIAQIAAKLGARVGENFLFACEDQRLRSTDDTILIDIHGTLDPLLPEEWRKRHLLHYDYLKAFASCSNKEWLKWVSSGRSGLRSFVPFVQTKSKNISRRDIEKELERRQFNSAFRPRYKNPLFQITDWDFVAEIWEHWENMAAVDDTIWCKVIERILKESQNFWLESITAEVTEKAHNGNARDSICSGLVPEWILKLREKECLHDTKGFLRKPAELLRRTPETEALMDVEPFVSLELDNPNSKHLLDLLGVGIVPTGSEKLLSRIRALTKTENHVIQDVVKWYQKLDGVIASSSNVDFSSIKSAFKTEQLILTKNENWQISCNVFLSSHREEDQGVETVHPSVRSLNIWKKIGVKERPTADHSISWLQKLPTGSLTEGDLQRVENLLMLYPYDVWEKCQHWLSLSGKWTPAEKFNYSLTKHSFVEEKRLHQWVRDKTANLQNLSDEVSRSTLFESISLLEDHIEERLYNKCENTSKPVRLSWLNQLALELQRIKFSDQGKADYIQRLAKDLAETLWQTTRDLEVISYVEGKPAETPRHADTFWTNRTLYTEDKPLAKLARSISLELGRSFCDGEIEDAIMICFDRSKEFVTDYIEGNFTLVSRDEIIVTNSEVSVKNKISGLNADDNEPKTTRDSQTFRGEIPDEYEKAIGEMAEMESKPPYEGEEGRLNKHNLITKQHLKRKSLKPSIMQRFALSKGFQKKCDDCFFDDDGNWIVESIGGQFPWEQRSASGEITCYYWPKDHCLQRNPLQLEVEIWHVVEKFPEKYRLILSDLEDKPIEITGTQIKEMLEQGATLPCIHPNID